jgi:hypothetical protein
MSSDHSNSACAAASLDEKPAVAEERGASAVPPSEGGLAGWMTVLGAFFALFASFGQSNAFGSYQAFYAQNQLSAYSASDISWIGSLQLWTYFASVCQVSALAAVLDADFRPAGCCCRTGL